MPISEVDICNQALAAVGVSQFIQSLQENSIQAIVLRQFYHTTRDQVLEEFPWDFADSYVQLQDIGTPPHGWMHRYRYPSDCIKARGLQVGVHLFRQYMYGKPVFAIIEDEQSGGKAIVANQCEATLHYTKRIINPALYSAKFITAFKYLLGSNVAAPLSAQPEYAQTALQAYQQAIIDAGASNMNEGDTHRQLTCDLLEARL